MLMKLATYKRGRDGRLLVVDSACRRATEAGEIAPTMQAALDAWQDVAPQLGALYERLNESRVPSFDFDPGRCSAPLPRAYQWIDGSAYVNHVELMRRSRNKPLPDSFWSEPLIYQGGSDGFSGPRDPIPFGGTDWGVDFEAEMAIVTDDVPMGVTPAEARSHIKLYLIANDVSLRRLIPGELAMGFGFFSGKPATAFSPVAVTPDEIATWTVDGELDLPIHVQVNGAPFGMARTGVDRVFTFPDLISRAARTRALGAGTIIGGGTVSNKLDGGPGQPISDGGCGYSCIAEQRAVETIVLGRPQTSWLQTGDRVTIEMLTPGGETIFGKIEQRVTPYSRQTRAS
jgi:fumarylacetoacetate (FAA) hydrolase